MSGIITTFEINYAISMLTLTNAANFGIATSF